MEGKRIVISGKVQGVFFRQSTKERAVQLGVTGWVRNNNDGSVEAHAFGESEALEKLIAWCHEGPSGAKVNEVKTYHLAPSDQTSFEIMSH